MNLIKSVLSFSRKQTKVKTDADLLLALQTMNDGLETLNDSLRDRLSGVEEIATNVDLTIGSMSRLNNSMEDLKSTTETILARQKKEQNEYDRKYPMAKWHREHRK